ncbi:MAG: MMPL family transporter [Myxococcales bacterium]|nr:MMPL family transporter [Myxococcales bacterium]
MNDQSAFITRGTTAYARLITTYPGRVLAVLLALGVISGYLTSTLTIESDQLALISQDLPEVKAVRRVIDMVGGAGYLQFALRADDEKAMKKLSDELYVKLKDAKQPDGTPWVRFITYKVPVDFIQENMVLFIRTEDLAEGKKRISAYMKDQLRRANPFFIEIKKTEPVKLDLDDLVTKYSSVGKKSIRDDFYISDDKKMLMMLVKPMWNSTELQMTEKFVEFLTGRKYDAIPPPKMKTDGLIGEVGKSQGIELLEDYETMGDSKTVYFGFSGSYKTALDDSYAIQQSLDEVTLIALFGIAVVTMLFFRKWFPTLLVLSGVVLGTIYTMGFAKLAFGDLNMITSIIGAIILGFGIDFGLHFTFRTRIELGMGKPYEKAIFDALINAGRPALVAAVVTAGSFFVLLVSEFRGFSQFGLLSGVGTILTGFCLFSWCPSILLLLGRKNPTWPAKLIGTMAPPSDNLSTGVTRIPAPKLTLAIMTVIVLIVCAFAIPFTDETPPNDAKLTLFERLKYGTQFNYNTRALVPPGQPAIKLQDEISRRFQISSDPIAVPTESIEEARDIWYALTKNPEAEFNVDREKFPTVDQVVSIYSFVPPPKTAEANAKILAEWREELKDIDVKSLPPEMQDKADFFMKVLSKEPFQVDGVPEVYAANFRSLPETKAENKGYLTFLYPKIDLWDGKNLIKFANQSSVVKGVSGKEYRGAGLPILYAKLAEIVLHDGKVTVLLAGIWILVMHYLDFRSVKLAAASVIPLGVGLVMMLGIMSIFGQKLNFMNLVMMPILLGFGVSHGLYLLHRFLEGTPPLVALRSVGSAVAASTLTTVAGFASLIFAQHYGLQSIGIIACIGLGTTLLVSFTVLAAVLQIIYDAQSGERAEAARAAAAEAGVSPSK